MPLSSPNLDDRTYDDLVAEARSLLPALAPDWTDHNPADPGITLIELFAWLTDILLYRVNQVTDENRLAFLRLITGEKLVLATREEIEAKRRANQVTGGNRLITGEKLVLATREKIEAETREAIRELRTPARAVTANDFERLALTVEHVKRAHCVPRRDLTGTDRKTRNAVKPADVSVVILPEAGKDPTADVTKNLEGARLLTTQVHVVKAEFVRIALNLTVLDKQGIEWGPGTDATAAPVQITLMVHAQPGFMGDTLLRACEDALLLWFNEDKGGPDSTGWPLGRTIYTSEIYHVLSRVQGVSHIEEVAGLPELAAQEWRVVKDDHGKQLVGIDLDLFELPRPERPEKPPKAKLVGSGDMFPGSTP